MSATDEKDDQPQAASPDDATARETRSETRSDQTEAPPAKRIPSYPDPIDDASAGSFPASDPPPWTLGPPD